MSDSIVDNLGIGRITELPDDIREKLAELELELSEGKSFEKDFLYSTLKFLFSNAIFQQHQPTKKKMQTFIKSINKKKVAFSEIL
jgi:hypothetical protein